MYNHEIAPCPKSYPDSFRVYGGVRKDIEIVAEGFADSQKEPISASERGRLIAKASTYLALDLPLCTALDTALLPITIPMSILKHWSPSRKEADTPSGPEVDGPSATPPPGS
jgi:hypothetical protein